MINNRSCPAQTLACCMHSAYRCRELYERLKVAASSNRRTITAEISADFPRCRSPIMRLLSNRHTVAIGVPAQCKLIKIGQVFAPGAARRYAPAADGSSTRGGSTSVRGRVRSPLISGGRPAAGSQRAYIIGWDRQTDGQIAVSLNAPPPYGGGIKHLPGLIYLFYKRPQCRLF